jgi:hypothetical protein
LSLYLGLASLDLTYVVVGAAGLHALGILRPGAGELRHFGLAYLFGWALLGVSLSLLGMVGFDPDTPGVLGVGVVLTALSVLLARRIAPLEPTTRREQRRSLGTLAALGGLIVLAVACAEALVVSLRSEWNASSDFDALWFWIPRAETIFYAHGFDPALWKTFTHPEYPPLAPTMDAVTFHFSDGFQPALLLFQQALLGVAFLAAIFALLDRFVPRWIALPSLALIATAHWFWSHLDSPMPDQTLAYLVSAAAVAAVLWLWEPRGAWLVLATVFLAAAALTKLEGVMFSALLAALLIICGLVRYRRRGLTVLWAALGPAVIEPWRLWLSVHGLRTSSPDYHPSDLLNFGFLSGRTWRLSYGLEHMVSTAENMLTQISPFGVLPGPLASAATTAAVVFFVGALAWAIWRLGTPGAALAGWFTIAFFGLSLTYWIGRIGVAEYVEVTVKRVEETMILVPATVTPLLLGLLIEQRRRLASA